jgi:hypothetical protein
MSVALRTITRLQDADDINVSLGAGVDEYALSWDNDTAKFVLRAVTGGGVTDHGALTGLSDDDHTGYALLAGRSGGQTLAGGTAVGDGLTLKGTTANGTASTSAIALMVGNNGATTGIKVNNAGDVGIYSDPYYQFAMLVKWKNTTAYRHGLTIQDVGTPTNANSTYPFQILYSTGTPYFTVDKVGNVYMAGSATVGGGSLSVTGASPLTITSSYSAPAVPGIYRGVTFGRNPNTGTPAAGFGSGISLLLKSSTTNDRIASAVDWSWVVETDASRAGRLVLSACDYNAQREGLRIDSNGSAALLGFYGHAATTQQVLATGAGASVDDVITALQNLGLVKQS